jgi:glycosyltransferase involved in cell wall biosynthesis
VAGYVYSGGRKGEDLLAAALQTEAGKAFDWRAIGRGWPVPTKRIAYDNLEEFYQELDLLVCTSLIEGVPYPPLEALACGVPIVIPRGVGLLDDLPDVRGIFRYDVGDTDGLVRALGEAQALKHPDRAALRDATESFTLRGWVQGHRAMFDALEIPEVAYTDRRTRKWVNGRGWVMGWEGDQQ